MDKQVKAILLMAGQGERFGSELPKQLHKIAGKKIYFHTLERFASSKLFEEILLVCPRERVPEIVEETKNYAPLVRIVAGGASRQESSYLGLLACGPDTGYVVIHDAVRPFVSQRILSENVTRAKACGAVDTCIPSADTIVYAPEQKKIQTIPSRSEYLRGQTPQSFAYSLILEAHEKARHQRIEGASDDCQIALAAGADIHVVLGEERNIKITSQLDLFLAEHLFRLQEPIFPLATPSLLQSKRFVVTGGTGGIGQAICSALRAEGAEPIALSRHSTLHAADLTEVDEVTKAFDTIGPIDGLINSVGILSAKELSSLTPAAIDEMLRVNLYSLIWCCKYAHIKPGGHLVNIASSAYYRGRKELAIYGATKAAVVNFTQALSEERDDLFVNVLVPQRTNTALRRQAFPNEPPQELLSPDEVAAQIIAVLKQPTTGRIFEVRKSSNSL